MLKKRAEQTKFRVGSNGFTGKLHMMAREIRKDFVSNKVLLLMTLPVLAYYVIFHYMPMYGIIISFKNYSPFLGIADSAWVGLKNFKNFFSDIYLWRIVRNTFMINFYQLLFSFPAPIILALLLNEVSKLWFKKTVQTISYMPHFISMVVTCGIIVNFFSVNGPINNVRSALGMERVAFLLKPQYFRAIYVGTGIWSSIGWGSIIYIAALSKIDQELYDAASIDGAGRWRKLLSVTLPGIAPMIVILLILNIGRLMSEGSEKVILLYNPLTYETADIISSYVFRRGFLESNFSYSSAVGLINSIVNFLLLVTANAVSRKINETSLW